MNRQEYILRLKAGLQGMPATEIQDILSDYEEHFDIGISKGKTEEEISKELGDPNTIAGNYKSSYNQSNYDQTISANYSNDNTRKLIMIFLLGLFNIIIVLGPYLAILGMLLSIYGLGLAFILGGISLMLGLPFAFLHFISNPHILTSLSFGIGLGSLGILAIILAVFLTKLIYQLTVKYIKWNVDLVNKGGF